MPTAEDVAAAARVSPSTVSRALSRPELVSLPTRTRVLQAAEELGYHPNRAARQLITGRTGQLGLVVPDLANPFFANVAKAVQKQALEHDRAVLVADTDEDPRTERRMSARLLEQVDGLVLCSPRMPESQLVALASHGPVVLLNRTAPGVASVSVDHAEGMRHLALHLRALGHRSVAFAEGPPDSWSNTRRREALTAAAEELDLEVVPLGNFAPRHESGTIIADLVIARGATAVLAYNDLVALGVLARLHARGVDVPGRVSVVGTDDVPMAGMVHPSLTTLAIPTARLGRTGVDLLVAVTDGGAAPDDTPLAAELIIRQTTDVPHVPADRQKEDT